MQQFRDLLPEKFRKDAVQCVEYLVTGSPEAMAAMTTNQRNHYFEKALQWIEEKHGATNVFYAGVHLDETTPHMYAYVVPNHIKLDELARVRVPKPTLNARHFFGGAKALAEMQTDFAQNVGKQFGLDRGVERSKAKHVTIRQYYKALNEAVSGPEIDPKDLEPQKTGFMKKEAPEEVANRLNQRLKVHRLRQVTTDGQQKQIGTLNKEVKRLSERVEKTRWVEDAYPDWDRLKDVATKLRRDREDMKRLERRLDQGFER
jgi:hypothetical protein